MKALVTGGAGYLGTELVRQLCKSPDVESVVVYDNLSRGCHALFLGEQLGPNVELVQADILDSRSLNKAVAGADVLFHLAGYVSAPHAHLDTHVYEQVNHWGTAEVAAAFERSSAERLIYISSTSIYGDTLAPATEQSRPNPRTSYCQSKFRGEQQVARLMNRRRVITLRLANVYGYSDAMRFDAVINKFAFQARYNKHISLHGTGKQERAFMHIDDTVAVLAQLRNAGVPSGTYNLGSNNCSVLELLDGFKAAIPELEFSFVDQHFELNSFSLGLDLEIANYCCVPDKRLIVEELARLSNKLAF
ncbi:MAG: SDR family oxidoreductase [Hyphomicrobiales bacterium]